MTATQTYMAQFIETKNLPIKDENGHITTFGELAKRYRYELEVRSKYWRTRWWDNEQEEKKWRNRRRHKPL